MATIFFHPYIIINCSHPCRCRIPGSLVCIQLSTGHSRPKLLLVPGRSCGSCAWAREFFVPSRLLVLESSRKPKLWPWNKRVDTAWLYKDLTEGRVNVLQDPGLVQRWGHTPHILLHSFNGHNAPINSKLQLPPPGHLTVHRARRRGQFERCVRRVGNLNRISLLIRRITPVSFFSVFAGFDGFMRRSIRNFNIPPRAYPGHLTVHRAQGGGNLNVALEGWGIWTRFISCSDVIRPSVFSVFAGFDGFTK